MAEFIHLFSPGLVLSGLIILVGGLFIIVQAQKRIVATLTKLRRLERTLKRWTVSLERSRIVDRHELATLRVELESMLRQLELAQRSVISLEGIKELTTATGGEIITLPAQELPLPHAAASITASGIRRRLDNVRPLTSSVMLKRKTDSSPSGVDPAAFRIAARLLRNGKTRDDVSRKLSLPLSDVIAVEQLIDAPSLKRRLQAQPEDETTVIEVQNLVALSMAIPDIIINRATVLV